MQEFDLLRTAVTAAILLYASVSDIKQREVSDKCWWILGIFGIGCMIYSVHEEVRWEHVLMIIGTAMILADILVDMGEDKRLSVIYHIAMAAMFIIPLAFSYDDATVIRFAIVPLAFVVFIGLFMSGMTIGGADVKCMIVLAMVFTSYPVFFGFPMIDAPQLSEIPELILQFPLMLFYCAVLLNVFVALYLLLLNIVRKDLSFPHMFIGYRMNIQDARTAHIVPMQTVSDGKVVMSRKVRDKEGLDDLERAGAERIWVTPMIPFIVPLTAAFFILVFIGNPLFFIL